MGNLSSPAGNWLGMLSTGSVPSLADGDTLRVTYAMVCGMSEWELMRKSRQFAQLEANGRALAEDLRPGQR